MRQQRERCIKVCAGKPLVDSPSDNVASLASACTYVLATACCGTQVCPASICLFAIHCPHHAPGRISACTMRGLSLPSEPSTHLLSLIGTLAEAAQNTSANNLPRHFCSGGRRHTARRSRGRRIRGAGRILVRLPPSIPYSVQNK
nr:unnamed protein product [Spirometra erinaceieuropaei]